MAELYACAPNAHHPGTVLSPWPWHDAQPRCAVCGRTLASAAPFMVASWRGSWAVVDARRDQLVATYRTHDAARAAAQVANDGR